LLNLSRQLLSPSEKRVGISEWTIERALPSSDLSMGESVDSGVNIMNRGMDVFFLHPN
jgi:hypothetical protein